MFNLIRKDLVIQRTQILLFIPFIMFFAIFADQVSPAFVFLLASTYIPLNAFIYDEQVESNILLNSLPYTRKEIVASKYIGSIVYMVLGIGIASLILYIFNYEFALNDIIIAIGLFLIFSAFAFPLFYILKPGYIGIVALFSLMFLAIILPPIFSFLSEHLTTITDFLTSLSTTTLYVSGAVISIGLYLISWMISQFLYMRKTF